MALIASSIPNLVGGVSQQPPALRQPTSCQVMENAWPSVVNGLLKRPPSQHIATISGLTITNSVAGYIVDRGDNYRYITAISNGDLKVYDAGTGVAQTVTYPDGKSYLSSSAPVDDFRFITLGDYTFVVNRSKVITTSAVAEPVSGTRLNPAVRGVIYVAASVANTYYSVYINNTLKASYLSAKGVDAASSVADTVQIASALASDLTAAGYTITQTGSTITISNLTSTDTIRTQGNSGDKSVKAFKDSVQSFSDLPPNAPEGLIVQVRGDAKETGDDYYVIYKSGVWVETVGYGECVVLTASTMPHVLVRNFDGTWVFKKHTWSQMDAGDADSNANPSFVDYAIKDIFVYGNRLGLLSDENVILSETGIFENFYRTTVSQLIDSDRIDIAVLNSNVNTLYHAIPYNNDLLLMSDRTQFRLKYQNYLGPKTVEAKYTTSFNVSTRIKPVNIGPSVYFVDDRSDNTYMKLYEYYPKENVFNTDTADEVTSPVPEYIDNDIAFLAASNRARAMLMATATDPTALYVYKYYWAGDQKVQTAWNRWPIPDCVKIHWGYFSGSLFYMLVERKTGTSTTGLFLEMIKCDEDVFGTSTNYELLVDRRITATSKTYSSVTDKTTITLPYATTATAIEVVSNYTAQSINGYRHVVTKVSNTTITVPGDVTAHTVTVGIPYTFLYEFSPVYARETKGQGETVMLDGRLQIRYITVEYHDTAYFQTELVLPGRDTFTSVFSGRTVGNVLDVLGSQSFASGYYRIPVMSRNTDARLSIINDTPFPSAFGSAEWSGQYSPKASKRI